MSQPEPRWTGWRGVCLVAVTYVYFLIFAQFAFLKRLADLGIAGAHLKTVMAAMAVGGILCSLLAGRMSHRASPTLLLRVAFLGCATAASFTLLAMGLAGAIADAFLIGSSLGLLTVTLVTHLRLWIGDRKPLVRIGLGTGLGYLICNLPAVFTATARVEAASAAFLCIAGIWLTLPGRTARLEEAPVDETSRNNGSSALSFPLVLASFTALIWLDSAAFFIIQSTPALKAGTWEGSLHLWGNGIVHLGAALASVWLLRRRGLSTVLSLAFVALAVACLLLLDPSRALMASVFYPVGVSLYSVALVAYPSVLAPSASADERGRRAGWIYAIAGWIGSAMGIGMGQNLGHVPPGFVLAAGLLVLAPQLLRVFRQRQRECVATLAVLGVAFCLHEALKTMPPTQTQLTAVQRGRQVYISEGCINCHSQYVRPNTPDVLMWGPVQTVEELHRERPPLIGNRREGPDLSEVGARRSPLWMKAHFFHPSEVSHASFMPSYAYLFRDARDHRGDDLIAYLQSLRSAASAAQQIKEQAWRPSPQSMAQASAHDGERLATLYCATCHAANGATRERWKASFRRLPPDLTTEPFLYLQASDSAAERTVRLARMIKFGLSGTDMPGHEYLPDSQIVSIAVWLNRTIPRPYQESQPTSTTGEKP
jgi:cbb3-type cytochrome oxidase cytochrome c subunit